MHDPSAPHRSHRLSSVSILLMVCGLLVVFIPLHTVQATAMGALSQSAQQQIAALMSEKAARSPAQQKIDSKLLYALMQRQGRLPTSSALHLRSSAVPDSNGFIGVDISASVSAQLLVRIKSLGGT